MFRWTLVLLLAGCLYDPKDPPDEDGDGYYGAAWSDCDDKDDDVHRGAIEICDGKNNDCYDELPVDEEDLDGDGVMGCEGDCDDTRADVNPNAPEICDGETDEDCDGVVDEDDALDAPLWYLDADGDGFPGGAVQVVSCVAPDGYISSEISLDCDDLDPDVNLASSELCDGKDDDCDGEIDEDDAVDASLWFLDDDGDGFGDEAVQVMSCVAPAGYVSADFTPDCDDTNAMTHPEADETCDGVDNDCDEEVDEDDAIDASLWYLDGDGDGFGDELTSWVSCAQPDGYVAADLGVDCDDLVDTTYPDADEMCDGQDNDCDGVADEYPAETENVFYADADDDSYGDPDTSVPNYCTAPDGYVENAKDCDDGDASTYEGAIEICDAVDQDCDGDAFYDPVDYITVALYGTGYTSANNSIQAGIDEAQSASAKSTVVCVAPGVYEETVELDGSAGDVQVFSQEGSSLTTIDAKSFGRVLTISKASADTVFQGFTLTRGSATTDTYSDPCGGGLSVGGSPTLEDVVVSGNETIGNGGGVCLQGGDPVLIDLDLSDNKGAGGGGMYISGGNPILQHIRVLNNKAMASDGKGGGVYIEDAVVTARMLVVEGNFANHGSLYLAGSGTLLADGLRVWSNTTSGEGAGIFMATGSTGSPVLDAVHVDIRNNTGSAGVTNAAALLVEAGTISIENAIIAANASDSWTAYFDVRSSTVAISQATFIRNSATNTGGAIGLDADSSGSTLRINNSSFFANTASRCGGDDGCGGLIYLRNSALAAAVQLSGFSYCQYDSNEPEDFELTDYGTENRTCTPTFADISSSDPTAWDLSLSGDPCTSGYGSGGADIGAYGGPEGSTWPDEADWP